MFLRRTFPLGGELAKFVPNFHRQVFAVRSFKIAVKRSKDRQRKEVARAQACPFRAIAESLAKSRDDANGMRIANSTQSSLPSVAQRVAEMIRPSAKHADQHVATAERIEHLLRQMVPYKHRAAKVDCLETHTSWVSLTDRFAIKLKRPARFDVLGFSTVARREQACRDALSLSHRLAREVYLDVLSVSLLGKQVRLGPGGKVIDGVVKMRRLPADRSLDRLIVTGSLRPHAADRIGDVLSEFYVHLTPVTIKTDEYLNRIAHHIRGSERELRKVWYELDAALVGSVCEAQRQYLTFGRESL